MKAKNTKVKPSKSELMQKLMKNSKSDVTEVLSECDYLNNPLNVPIDVPIMNVGFSGNVKDGFGSGINIIAGPSRHYKTLFVLKAAKAFLNKFDDGIILFYDSEFGTTKKYFESMDIPEDKVIRTEITDMENLQNDIVSQLNGLDKTDNVFIMIDSMGSLASLKEMNNANEGDIKADVGVRAKEIKSLMRIITPKINSKKVPCFIVAHTYKTMEKYAKTILGGGEGMMLAPNTVWFVSKSKEKDKDTKELLSNTFTIRVEKSRLAKEESRLPIEVSFDKGIKRFSGLIELAVGFGIVEKVRQGHSTAYAYKDVTVLDSYVSEDEKFWDRIFKETNFCDLVEGKYSLGKSDTSNASFDFDNEASEDK